VNQPQQMLAAAAGQIGPLRHPAHRGQQQWQNVVALKIPRPRLSLMSRDLDGGVSAT